VKRSANLTGGALLVHGISHRERVRVDLNDRVDRRPLLVDGVDARQVFFRDRTRGVLARFEAVLKLGDRDLIEFETGYSGRGCSVCGAGKRRQQCGAYSACHAGF
jgi:hypothetical protein